MTPTDEARFLQLWQEGASYAVIAEALGCAIPPHLGDSTPDNR